MDTGLLVSYVLSLMSRKITVPSTYHDQVDAVKQMLTDDVSGIIDSLTDFSVDSASVNYSIEFQNDNLNKLFENWLKNINIDYAGQIPMGIDALAKEYFKERWKGSSFCVLKIAKWDKVAGSNIIVPSRMFFVDGRSINAEEKDKKDELKILSYDYYLGKDKDVPLTKDVIITKPFARWFDKYPVPFLIKRGVYHNYRLTESLKKRQAEVLDQIIPYMLLIKKGTEALAKDNKTYTEPELQSVIDEFQTLVSELKTTTLGDTRTKTPVRATNFDEELKHLIPDLSTMFKTELFEEAERNILSGLGFIEVVQGVASSNKESALNPKPFMAEITAGVKDFKEIIHQLLYIIKQKNDSHIKYNNEDAYICSSPVKSFQTDKFRDTIRQLYDRGQVSKKTYVELCAEVDYNTEIYRREKETKTGLDYTMYPPITKNDEEKGIDNQGKNPDPDVDPDNIPEDKKGQEAQNYDIGSETSEVMEEASIFSESDEIELSFKPKITENYIRLRQQDPKLFDNTTFKTIVISPTKQIKAIVGKKPTQTNTEIQSYLFKKEKWNVKDAKAWETEHAVAYSSIVEKTGLVTAPYTKVADLPTAVKKLDIDKQRAWMDIFNNAYKYMLTKTGNEKTSETYAFRVAFSKVKKVNIQKSFLEKLREKLTKKPDKSSLDTIEEDEIEREILEENNLKKTEMEIAEKKSKLLDKLLKEDKDENI